MKKVLIVDDESDARSLLREYLMPYTSFDVIGECENGLDAVQKINRLEPDIVFLDIQMPALSGFQVVQQIIHVPQIIFTTAYDQYALKAFDTNAIDYLLKPYTAERFSMAMTKASAYSITDFANTQKVADEYTGGPPTRILVECGNKMVNIHVSEILFFEADKDYTRIHTEAKSYLSNYGIGVLEQRMDTNLFLRIHRSFIVNMNHVKEVHKEGYSVQVILKNEKCLNVSRSYMDGLRKFFY